MCLSDTAEYWNDVKKQQNKRVFTHIKNFNCGHFHVVESNEFDDIDCYSCLNYLKENEEKSNELKRNNGKRISKQKKEKGFKLDSKINFGKYKNEKTIVWLIENDPNYFNWLKDKILLNGEVDEYLKQIK